MSDEHQHEWIKLPNRKDRCLRCREIRDMGNVVKCQASGCPKKALTLHEDGGRWLWLCDAHGDAASDVGEREHTSAVPEPEGEA